MRRCAVCSGAGGRRACLLKELSLICPVCCARIRNPDCEGCSYWAEANAYARSKTEVQRERVPHFTARIDPEIDAEVDRALRIAEQGRVSAAERVLSELLRTDGDLYMVHFGMGVIRGLQERYDEAIRYFDRAVAIFPYCIEAWFNKAVAHQSRLEIKPMIRAYQKVLALGDPAEDLVARARAFLADLEKQVRAENGFSLDRYLELVDLFDQAFVAMENREWERALAGFRRVAAADPGSVQAHGNMGLCLASLRRKREALAALERALEIDPGYEPAMINRTAVLAMEEGQRGLAADVLTVEYYKERFLSEHR
jgi:tetratricopeptide (TPR) repeat protein